MVDKLSTLTKVLVVEDSVLLSARIVNDIHAVGRFEVVATADTESDAIKAIDHLCPDIVVTDLRLREGSGVDVLRYSQQSDCDPTPRVLVLTNYDSPVYRSHCLALGAAGVFDKSSEYRSFLQAMRGAVGSQAKH
ncbi:MAG: response regulator transcription factor [Betaproteobacteria bacterium]